MADGHSDIEDDRFAKADLHRAAETVRALAELEGKQGALRLPEEPIATQPRSAGAGWFAAVGVGVVALAALLGIYIGVVGPLQEKVSKLSGELSESRIRQEQTRSEAEALRQENARLEAAADALNSRVEEQEGERESLQERQEKLDANARRREEERKKANQRKRRKKTRRR